MKILGTFFRLLCALVVLLALAVLLDGSLQVSLSNYISAFTPEHVLPLFSEMMSWPVIAAGALLLLTLCCGIRLGWNLVYSVATLCFFAEVALMLLGPELALPTCMRGLSWEQPVRELALNYPVPTLMIPALCVLGCLCSSAPVRIAWTSLLCLALCYGCAELFYLGVLQWQAMPEPFMPHALHTIQCFPWMMAALPAAFFVQFCLFMALFESISPRKKKVDEPKKDEKGGAGKADEAKKDEDKKADDKKEEEKKEDKPAPTISKPKVTPAPVLVKRPVIHKKSPVSPAAGEAPQADTKPTPTTEEAPAEEKKEITGTEETTPEVKTETSTTEETTAEDKKENTATEEPASEEQAETTTDAPPATPIPSVPLPPAPNAAS